MQSWGQARNRGKHSNCFNNFCIINTVEYHRLSSNVTAYRHEGRKGKSFATYWKPLRIILGVQW
jgi:hypothetical protein